MPIEPNKRRRIVWRIVDAHPYDDNSSPFVVVSIISSAAAPSSRDRPDPDFIILYIIRPFPTFPLSSSPSYHFPRFSSILRRSICSVVSLPLACFSACLPQFPARFLFLLRLSRFLLFNPASPLFFVAFFLVFHRGLPRASRLPPPAPSSLLVAVPNSLLSRLNPPAPSFQAAVDPCLRSLPPHSDNNAPTRRRK